MLADPVFASAKVARRPRGEIIRQRGENLGAEGRQKRAPAFAGQRGSQRANALGGDDWDALRLARETEESLVAGRVAFAHGCEVLLLIAKEENLPEILLGVRLDFRNAIEHGALKIELHHHAESFRESGVHAHGEIQGTDSSMLDKPSNIVFSNVQLYRQFTVIRWRTILTGYAVPCLFEPREELVCTCLRTVPLPFVRMAKTAPLIRNTDESARRSSTVRIIVCCLLVDQ